MKAPANTAILGLACVSLALSAYAVSKKTIPSPAPEPTPAASNSAPTALADGATAALERRLAKIEATLGRVSDPDQPSGGGEEGTSSIDDRLQNLETMVANLQSSMDGITLEAASEERDELFRSDDGNLKADEYFAAGKFAIAGEGYLKFLEAHPDHPDAYDVLARARAAFRRAGYMDKAIWAQKELIKNRGSADDYATLAQMEKLDGQYANAVEHISQAADMLDGSDRLWRRMYWAWYTQLAEGVDAGLAAYREVEQEIIESGFDQGNLGRGVRDKIANLERMRAAGR